jgi:small subunit ribosomal protein S6
MFQGSTRGGHSGRSASSRVGNPREAQTTKGGLPSVTREYEAVYVFDSTLEDAAINDKLARHHALLGAEGEIALNHWGRRQLAYKIGKRETGYYVVARFKADGKVLPEFERALKLDDGVVRYLISIYEHELGAPPMSEEELALRRSRDDDDEDDE